MKDRAIGGEPVDHAGEDITELAPMVRRIVISRAGNHPAAEDLVQEALTRLLAAHDRIEPGLLEPYAITTVRNVIASMWRGEDRERRNRHRTHDPSQPQPAEESVIASEEQRAMTLAVQRLDERDRQVLVAHEVRGEPTLDLAQEAGTTSGAVAAQLKRARARLRVEYLLALEHIDPPTDRCRSVLLSLSSGEQRRQQEVEAAQHLLECAVCEQLSAPLLARRPPRDGELQVSIRGDGDIVAARQAARALAVRAGFTGVDLTFLATAVSEVARNIVRFAHHGVVTVTLLEAPKRGVRVIARDSGPGIPDIDRAMTDGYSTDDGLGLGLPGARRLVDEFDIVSAPGRGTTVVMSKWFGRKARG